MYKFQFLTKSCKYHICTLLSIYKIQQESKILEFMQTLQRVRSDCQQQSVSFSHNKNLYDTPVKNSSQVTAQKTLKKSILQKLQASKNLSINRPISKKLSMKQSKQQESAQKQLMKANNEQMTEEKQIILNNQSPSNPGFYQYAQWLKINELFFQFVNKKFVEEFWKILRLINYGQVFIPTGLIYQIFVDIKRNSNSSNFQNIINKFLKQNQTVDRMQNFKDLKSYTHISIIEKSYKCMDQNDEMQNTVEHNQNDRKLRTRSQSAKNVFQRNYAQAKFRTDKKISKICQNLIKQVQQIQEKPKISVYKSESYQSLVKPERICKHADQHKSKSQQEKYMQENNGVLQNLFKAKQLDRSIFESNVDSIPGVLSHLSRNKFCQAEKLKAKRESEKPQYSKKKKF